MTDDAPASQAGLFTTDDEPAPVPLDGVSIAAELRGLHASVVISQRYVNRETRPIEAVYLFPIDEAAAISGFEAIVDGTLVVGEVHEREHAFEVYDDAMRDGHGGFLLDEERPDVFQASIGNLLPGRAVTVRITYVTELAVADGRVRFAIPTTVSPRYAPAQDRSGIGRPDAEALNPPVAFDVPYGLTLEVRASMPQGITGVESPSHPIAISLINGSAHITLSREDAALDRDFVLSVETPGLDGPQVIVERTDAGEQAIAIDFAPVFSTPSRPAEIIFLVDRSGSMAGESIGSVKKALQLCLRSMSDGCRFNVVGFGSSWVSLFPESRPYDQAALDAATAHIARLKADLGGTEILPAIQFVLERPPAEGLPRQVVVLTDGEVTNTDAVIALAAAHSATTRIFTFGMGAGASHHLVRGLARAGRGAAEFIFPGERVEPKILRQFARLLSPVVEDVHVDWIGGCVTQAPSIVPPVFSGGRLLVYGIVDGELPSRVRLSGTTPTGPLSFDLPIDGSPVVHGRLVSTLAARARIRELEEGEVWLAARGSRQQHRGSDAVTREIVELSKRYGLISRETSFVAVERRETPVTGDVELRKVRVALTSGWSGGRRERMVAPSFRMSAPVIAASARLGAPMFLKMEADGRPGLVDRFLRALRPSARPPVSMPPPGQPSHRAEPPAEMHPLILLQRADGTWELDDQLAALLGRDLDELRAAMRGARGRDEDVRRAWATALALAWLKRHAAGIEEEWHLLAAKGHAWIDDVDAAPPDGLTWTAAASKFLDAG